MPFDLFKYIGLIADHYEFSGPVIVWFCYQILKLIVVKIEHQAQAVWASISTFGAEINIICIPILFNLRNNSETEFYKEYTRNPDIFGWSLIFLVISAGLSLFAMKMFETKPRKQFVVEALIFLLRATTKVKSTIEGICGIIRKGIYFVFSIGIGVMWFISLYYRR